jgi:hypothetical protein
MKCQDCIYYHEAPKKFELVHRHIAFLCSAKGQLMSEHSETPCEHFRLVQSAGVSEHYKTRVNA